MKKHVKSQRNRNIKFFFLRLKRKPIFSGKKIFLKKRIIFTKCIKFNNSKRLKMYLIQIWNKKCSYKIS